MLRPGNFAGRANPADKIFHFPAVMPMSTIDSETAISAESSAAAESRHTRIDAPHCPAPENDQPGIPGEVAGTPPLAETLLEVEEPTPEMLAAVAGETLEARREQLQLQVAQLAEHLRERLREVDRRESALNARVAQLESDLRASRLWIRERELEFQSREGELRRKIEELEEQTAARHALTGQEKSTPDSEAIRAELEQREQELRMREDDARERRFEADRQAAALRHAQQLWQQQREREEQQLEADRRRHELERNEERAALVHTFQERIEHREAQLRTAELLVAGQARQLDQDQAALASERQAWQEARTRQRQSLEEQRSAAEAELGDRRQRLAARQEWIERQKVGLERVRDEALKLHRQSLEMRLLAEQLWAQITGRLHPAEVTQAVAQLRLKLGEQYGIEEQQLAARRQALAELAERITAQHEELLTLRSGLREWAAARHAEIGQQAAALVQRELALDAEHERLRQLQQEWQANRRSYEQQIRDLTCQLRTLPAAA
jgi:hypothetical protein